MRAASSSSTTHLFGSTRDEDRPFICQSLPQLAMPPPPPPPPGSSSQFTSVPTKKKRNLPGNPSPEAEVIALSPRTLLATNRFVCEVCSKGFQREQNLQLHRRGHNLPWKLKQRNPNEVRRRVYLCPEPTCVHHDPSRALGDLTGVKKHYFRKHGEKKWKCDRCSKRYAVQSDWKAHSKICGTREYRCDCGTLFSRRDSFLTHSAFCDALARENARQSLAGAMGTISGAGQHLDSRGVNLGGFPQLHSAPISSFRCHRDSGGPPPPANSDDYLLHSRTRIDVSSNQFDVVMPQHHLDGTVSFRPPPPHQFPHSSPFFFGVEDSSAGLPALLHGGQVFDGASAINNSNLFNLVSCFFPTKIDQHGDESAMALFAADDIMGHHEGPAISSLYNPDAPPQLSATALLQKAAQMGGGPVFLRDFAAGSAESSRSTSERQYQDMAANSLAIPGGGGGFHHHHPGLIMHVPEEVKLSQRLSTRDFLGVHGSMMMAPASTNNHNM